MNLTPPSEPIFKGPFYDVLVVDNVVVAPAGLRMIPTMTTMFDTVHRDCIAWCPKLGASRCGIYYQQSHNEAEARGSIYWYISEAHIAWSEEHDTPSLEDGGRATSISWKVTSIRLCCDAASPATTLLQ